MHLDPCFHQRVAQLVGERVLSGAADLHAQFENPVDDGTHQVARIGCSVAREVAEAHDVAAQRFACPVLLIRGQLAGG